MHMTPSLLVDRCVSFVKIRRTTGIEQIDQKLGVIVHAHIGKPTKQTATQPSWADITARRPPKEARLTWENLRNNARPALIAIKSPPPRYQRELVIKRGARSRELDYSGERIVEELNRATERTLAKKQPQSVRKPQSGDVVLVFDTRANRDAWKDCKTKWIGIFGTKACTQQRRYTVLIHGIKMKECQNTVKTIEEIYRSNARLKEAGVEILNAVFQKRTLASSNSTGPLLVSVAEPEQANTMVQQEINWRYQAHNCELFEGNARPVQCFQCYKFDHMAKYCRQAARCGFCGKIGHETKECISKDVEAKHYCINCKGNHAAWSKDCPVVTERRVEG